MQELEDKPTLTEVGSNIGQEQICQAYDFIEYYRGNLGLHLEVDFRVCAFSTQSSCLYWCV